MCSDGVADYVRSNVIIDKIYVCATDKLVTISCTKANARDLPNPAFSNSRQRQNTPNANSKFEDTKYNSLTRFLGALGAPDAAQPIP